MKKDKKKHGYPPFRTMEEYNEHTRKMNYFFILIIGYSSGIFLGFIMDINLRYGYVGL